MPGLKRSLAYMNKQIVPTEDVVERFAIYARGLFARRAGLSAESLLLASLRDALLPRLVSGESRLTEGESVRRAGDEPSPPARIAYLGRDTA